MADRVMKTVLALDGEQAYKDAMRDIASAQTALNTELNKSKLAYRDSGDEAKFHEDNVRILNQQIEMQKKRVDETKNALKQANEIYGAGSREVINYERDLTRAELTLGRMEGELKRSNDQLVYQRSELPKTADAIKDLDKKQESLTNQMKLAESQYKLTGDKTEFSREKVRILGEQLETQNQKLEQSKIALSEANRLYGEGDDRVDEYKRAVEQASVELVEVQANLKNANLELKENESKWIAAGKAAQESGEKHQAQGEKLMRAGATMTVAMTAPLVAASGAAAKAAIDYEQAFAGVKKTVDGTAEELAGISDGILEMSKRMPSAATEIAGVAESAGQLGIKTDAILGFTEVIIGMGTATNLAGEQGAASMAQFANVTQMSQKDFDRLGSAIVDLGNNGASTEQDIMNMAMRIGSAGTQVGLTVPQILGLSASLTNVGIEAEAGGSAMSKLLINMQVAATTGDQANRVISQTGYSLRDLQMMASHSGEEFGDLAKSMDMTKAELKGFMDSASTLEAFSEVTGLTAKQFQKAFAEDATGALTLFIQGLAQSEEKGTNAIAVLDAMGITEVRLRDTILRTVNASDQMTETLDRSNTAWEENTALQKEVAAANDTTAAKLSQAKNEITAVGIELANEFLPKIADAAKGLAKLVSGFTDLDPATQKAILATAGVIAAIGPTVTAIGTLEKGVGIAQTAYGKFIEQIGKKKALEEASGAIGKTGGGGLAGALASPAGLVVGIGLAVGALYLLHTELSKTSKEARDLEEDTKRLTSDYDEQAKSIETNAGFAQRLADRLGELQAKEKLTNDEKREMVGLVDRLNEIYPDMNVLIDEETGLLNLTNEQLQTNLDLRNQQLELQAAESYKLDLIKEETTAKLELEKVEERLAGYGKYVEKNEDGSYTNKNMNTLNFKRSKEIADLIRDYESLTGTLDTVGQEITRADDLITEKNKSISESAAETAKDVKESGEETGDALIEQSETRKTAADLFGESVESTREHGSKLRAIYAEIDDASLTHEQLRIKYKTNEVNTVRDIQSEIAAIYEESKDDIDEYLKSHETLYESYLSSMGDLGTKGIAQNKLTAAEIKANLEQQIEDFQTWRLEIATISEKVPSDVAVGLEKLGPSATDLIKELSSMTDTELDEWVKVWQTKTTLAHDTATEELSGMPGAVALAAMDSAEAMDEGLAPMADYMAMRMIDTIIAFTDAGTGVKWEAEDLGKKSVNKFDNEFKELKFKAKGRLKETGREIGGSSIAAQMKTAGSQGMQGFIDGMNAKARGVITAATNIVNSVPQQTKKVLMIQSPSKVMRGLAGDTVDGFQFELEDRVKDVEKAGAKLAEAAIFEPQMAKLGELSSRSGFSDLGQLGPPSVSQSTTSTTNNKNEYITINVQAAPGMADDDARRLGVLMYQSLSRARAAKGE